MGRTFKDSKWKVNPRQPSSKGRKGKRSQSDFARSLERLDEEIQGLSLFDILTPDQLGEDAE